MGGPLFAVIFAGGIIFFLLVVGQLFYNKSPKLGLAIWGLTVLLLFYCIYSFNTAHSRRGDQAMNEYVGTYKIDIYQSAYDSVGLSNYKDLLLVVHGDNTFSFSNNTPFFRDTTGHWQHMDDGDISWTEISVGGKNLSEARVETDKWVFSGSELTNGNNNNSIVFVRQ
jgi:hypothetical protein